MQRLLRKDWLAALVTGLAMTFAAGLAARLLLRHISLFLSFDAQFSAIFAQIHDAKLVTPVALLMALAFPGAWGLRKLGRCGGWKIPAGIFWVLLWLVLLVLALLLTRVNGIRFWDVVASLLDILQKGGLDGL